MPTKSFDRTIVLNGESVDRIIAYDRQSDILNLRDRERIKIGKEALVKFQPNESADKSIVEKAP